MASGLVDVASKQVAIKARRDELAVADKQVDDLMRAWAPEELPAKRGCLPRISVCPVGWFSKGTRVATSEMPAVAAPGTASVIKQSGESNRLLNRLVGMRKESTSETQKIETAMCAVQSRVDSLSDRVKIGRERAIGLRQAGKQQEALRELKKSKGTEKQLAAARMALDTLEKQQDMIAQSMLQRELATALKSTTEGVKKNSKGLLTFAETAIDDAIEARDDVDDISAVFEGMQPAYGDADDDELLDELDLMMEEEEGGAAATTIATPPSTAAIAAPKVDAVPVAAVAAAFELPSVPSTRKQEKRALLAEDSAAAAGGL